MSTEKPTIAIHHPYLDLVCTERRWRDEDGCCFEKKGDDLVVTMPVEDEGTNVYTTLKGEQITALKQWLDLHFKT